MQQEKIDNAGFSMLVFNSVSFVFFTVSGLWDMWSALCPKENRSYCE